MSTIEHDPALVAWAIDDAEYPLHAGPAAQLAFLVRYAVLAPSDRNTQPWAFRLVGDTLELRADRLRALPVADPEGRTLVISCGAALGTLRLAARRFGTEPEVTLLPDPDQPDLLAVIGIGSPTQPTAEALRLSTAITARRTTRAAFTDRPLPAALLADLRAIVPADDVWLELVTDSGGKRAVADLVACASRLQMRDPEYRRELARWLRPNRAAARDGIRGYGFGLDDLRARFDPLVTRALGRSPRRTARERDAVAEAPALAVLGSSDDGPQAWLATGEALQRLLLRLADAGATGAFSNQPIELPELRSVLARSLRRKGVPQLLLRLGYATAAPRAEPRRSLAEVLTIEP